MGHRRHALRWRYGRASKKRATRELSVFERHQLAIARQTLNMPDPILGVMGGMTKEEARRVIRELTGKEPR